MIIEINEKQKKNLKAIGFEGLAEDTDNILSYVHKILEVLESHNKNYTKDQYYKISTLNDIFKALYEGF